MEAEDWRALLAAAGLVAAAVGGSKSPLALVAISFFRLGPAAGVALVAWTLSPRRLGAGGSGMGVRWSSKRWQSGPCALCSAAIMGLHWGGGRSRLGSQNLFKKKLCPVCNPADWGGCGVAKPCWAIGPVCVARLAAHPEPLLAYSSRCFEQAFWQVRAHHSPGLCPPRPGRYCDCFRCGSKAR